MNKDGLHHWYALYSLFFIAVATTMIFSLYKVNGSLPTNISLFDAILVILATFRFTRLFVYDKITFFIRDALQHAEETYTQEGVTYVRRVERTAGPLRTAYELLVCPWCFSIWAALLVAYAYFLNTQLFWLPIFIFAISGTATAIQICVNMVGWVAENKKLQARGREASD